MKYVLVSLVLLVLALGLGCRTAPQRAAGGPREVRLAVTENGFEPSEVRVPRGEALTLVVTRKTDQTCATSFAIPALAVKKELPLGQPVRIEVPAGVADTLRYVCGMSMLGGTIIAQ